MCVMAAWKDLTSGIARHKSRGRIERGAVFSGWGSIHSVWFSKARIYIESLFKGWAQKRVCCSSIQLVKQSALTLKNQTECNVDFKVKKYGVESLAQPLIEVLGGEPPMAQTHRRLPRRCRRRTAGGGGETRSRAIHPNFQVNNKQNPFMLLRKVNVKGVLKYFCNLFWILLSDTWAVAALEDEASLTRCCRMITTLDSLSWLSRRGSTPGSTTRPDEPRMTTRPAEPSWTTLSPDSSTRTSSWCHKWFLRYL